MLCEAPKHDDVIQLAQCLLRTWDVHYTIYYWLHYVLGGLGVLFPILATILSDLESKAMRRMITGLSAATVSVYAFLSPNENMIAYKSAHAELRQELVMYDEINKMANTPDGDMGTKSFILAAIADIEKRILNSEMASGRKQEGQNGRSGNSSPSATPDHQQ